MHVGERHELAVHALVLLVSVKPYGVSGKDDVLGNGGRYGMTADSGAALVRPLGLGCNAQDKSCEYDS